MCTFISFEKCSKKNRWFDNSMFRSFCTDCLQKRAHCVAWRIHHESKYRFSFFALERFIIVCFFASTERIYGSLRGIWTLHLLYIIVYYFVIHDKHNSPETLAPVGTCIYQAQSSPCKKNHTNFQLHIKTAMSAHITVQSKQARGKFHKELGLVLG